MKVIGRLKDTKLIKELANGVTQVMSKVVVQGQSEAEYSYSGKDVKLVVRGCWEGSDLVMKVSEMPNAPQEDSDDSSS